MISTNTALLIGLFVLVTIAYIWIIRTERRIRRIFRGRHAGDLEQVIREIAKGIQMHEEDLEAQALIIKNIEKRLHTRGHSIKMMRFNPFPEVGGNQSFAVAITNSDGDGFVLSSLYSRERMSVFAKPIQGGTSDIELSEEERTVVGQAHKDATKN